MRRDSAWLIGRRDGSAVLPQDDLSLPRASERLGSVSQVGEELLADLLRDAHRPGVEDQFAQFGVLEGCEADLDPLVALVRRPGREKFVRLGSQRRRPLLAGEADADGL